MANATQDIQSGPVAVSADMDLSQVEDMQEVVDQLVSEIEQTVGEIEKSRTDPEATPVEAEDVLSSDAVLTDSGESDVPVPQAAAEPVPDDASMEEQIDQMLDEASPADTQDASTEEAQGVSAESIEELDAQLAARADDSIDGDFETVEGEIASLDEVAEESVVAESPKPANKADAPARKPAAAAAASTSAPVPEIVVGAAGGTVLIPGSRFGLLAHPLVQRAAAIAQHVAPIGQRVLMPVVEVLSIPMRLLEPKMRDTIGWIAVNTMFLAVCVWLLLLMR